MPALSASRYLVLAGWDHVPHLSERAKRELLESTPAYLRDARSKGIPLLGSGAVFPVPDELILCDAFAIAPHWPQIGGIDFGWDHPTAGAVLAWDRDADVIYVTKDYRQSHATPVVHAAALKAIGGEWLPWAWPHDGNNDTAAGPALARQYAAQKLNVLPEHATWPDDAGGGNSVEAGVTEMLDRMQTGRWKVFRNCGAWMEEKRLYHRKDGRLVKLRDDVLCLHPDTQVITRRGVAPISNLVDTVGEVLSSDGHWAPYRSCRLTKRDAALVRVVFDDGHELVCTPDHVLLSASGNWVAAADASGLDCHNAVSSWRYAQWHRNCSSTANASPASVATGAAHASSSIARSGRRITDLCHRAITFTTATATRTTTPSRTSNCWTASAIYRCIRRATAGGLMQRLLPRLSGERPLKAARFSPKWATATSTFCDSSSASCAGAAASRSIRPTSVSTGSVPTPARQSGAGTAAPTWWMQAAACVVRRTRLTSSDRLRPARADAAEGYGFPPPKAGATSKVLRVESAGRGDVFCMEVEHLHALAIANGVVVHNCASRYALMMLRHACIAPRATRTKARGGSWRTV